VPNYDISPLLDRITCPTLVTVGRGGWITPVSCIENIAARVPGARLVVFEKSGDSPQLEEPEKFQRVVREFLTEAGPPPKRA
jgi:proline iminopeptidase